MFFGPFRFDEPNARVWRGADAIMLTPKAFAVLRHLVLHPNRLVTKEELLETVWPKTIVTDAVLKVCIGEIRKALADDAKAPQVIETVHRRGYRFVAPLTTPPPNLGLEARGLGLVPSPPLRSDRQAPSPKSQVPSPIDCGS